MNTAALYIRVSTDDQLEFSPDAQRRTLLNYAEQNNYSVNEKHIYIDEGISGRKAEKRPAFMKMIAAAKSREFDTILVHKFDRFARNREDSVVYKSLLRKEYNIKVISITESIEDDKFSIILEAMLEAMAEYYSINLSEEVKKGMTEKALKGGLQTTPSFGYTVENNRLITIPEEAEIVKYIFDEFVSGKSYMMIARAVNNMGIKTHRGNSFETRQVQYILNNPAYIGYLRWTPTKKIRRDFNNPDSLIIKAAHEAIIDEKTWKLAQAQVKEIKNLKKYSKPDEVKKHWLSGMVKCSNCGRTLINQGSFFQCGGYSKALCNISHYISTSKLEHTVISGIKGFIDEFDIKKVNIIPKSNTSKNLYELKILQNNLQKTIERQNRIKEAFLAGIDTIEEYKENKKNLSLEKQKLEDKINFLKAVKSDIPADYKSKFTNLYESLIDEKIDYTAKRILVNSIIEKIIYDKENSVINIYYYY